MVLSKYKTPLVVFVMFGGEKRMSYLFAIEKVAS